MSIKKIYKFIATMVLLVVEYGLLVPWAVSYPDDILVTIGILTGLLTLPLYFYWWRKEIKKLYKCLEGK